jgi:phosphoribosylaminoimidazolecarboxamide formyltransferase/IMP cyclohydrolase
MKIKTALISVSDKSNLEPLLKTLKKFDIEIISTGGTAKNIEELGYKLTEISEVTGIEEYPDGLVKSLHPRIHFGILFNRKNEEHINRLKKEQIKPIDLVVCNLYPFEKVVRDDKITKEIAIANIDIGGVAMIRAAAKNHKFVTVVTNPEDYKNINEEMEKNKGKISEKTRYNLAVKAFKQTTEYDSFISKYFQKEPFPEKLILTYNKKQKLRYGENPHQKAYFYKEYALKKQINIIKLQGKDLSYNNLNDLNSVIKILGDFEKYYENEKITIIVKHTDPCGIAMSDEPYESFLRAWNCDKISSFGSVIATNYIIDKKIADFIVSNFIEVILAEDFSKEALNILGEKKNLRLVKLDDFDLIKNYNEFELKFLDYGLLIQTRDNNLFEKLDLKSGDLNLEIAKKIITFGLICIKNIKSNAINIVREHKPGYFEQIGVGIGQPNRLISTRLAIEKAINNLKEEFDINYENQIKNLYLISDAFFPFPDNIEISNKFGIKNIVEPGGSIHDNEVIEAAKKYSMNLIFTGIRHFKH